VRKTAQIALRTVRVGLSLSPNGFSVSRGNCLPGKILLVCPAASLGQRSSILALTQETRTSASPSPSFSLGETSTTPASVMGAAVSGPPYAITGRPQAIPAMALPRRLEMCPRTNSKTSEEDSLRATSSLGVRRKLARQPQHLASLRQKNTRYHPRGAQRQPAQLWNTYRRQANGLVMTSLSRLPASPP